MGYSQDASLWEGLLQNKCTCRGPLGFGNWAREGRPEKRAFIYSSNKHLSSACYVSSTLPAAGNTVMTRHPRDLHSQSSCAGGSHVVPGDGFHHEAAVSLPLSTHPSLVAEDA